MKSYKEFEDLAERAFSPRGQAAREKMRQQAGLNAARKAAERQTQAGEVGVKPTSKQKLLPPGKPSPQKQSLKDYARQKAGDYARRKSSALAKRAADKGMALVKNKNYKQPKVMSATDKLRQKYKDEKQSGKGPDRAFGGGPYPKVQTPDKKAIKSNSEAAKRRALDKLKASTKKDTAPGGFMGGVKKSLGGDMFSKDPDKRREARYNRGKAMADGVKSKIGSLRKIRLQPPSTDTQIGDNQSVTGPKKFGKSAS